MVLRYCLTLNKKSLYKIIVIIYDYHWKCSISGYGFAGAQPILAKTAASLAVFRLSTVAPYLFPYTPCITVMENSTQQKGLFKMH